jgi:hypothetical protein
MPTRSRHVRWRRLDQLAAGDAFAPDCAQASGSRSLKSATRGGVASLPRPRYHLRLMSNEVTQLLSALGRSDPHAARRLLSLRARLLLAGTGLNLVVGRRRWTHDDAPTPPV